jgi:hypothetical protein
MDDGSNPQHLVHRRFASRASHPASFFRKVRHDTPMEEGHSLQWQPGSFRTVLHSAEKMTRPGLLVATPGKYLRCECFGHTDRDRRTADQCAAGQGHCWCHRRRTELGRQGGERAAATADRKFQNTKPAIGSSASSCCWAMRRPGCLGCGRWITLPRRAAIRRTATMRRGSHDAGLPPVAGFATETGRNVVIERASERNERALVTAALAGGQRGPALWASFFHG